ncbi:N-acetylneuraminate synthase family protein [Paenibacillus sp. OV219]|uniref:N-acetylneuraminate synthase family protein n=1 Tax=Paenibacillus sp. OV219 TaxID=1884377 RepID=UPI0008B48941|nr:N-acetylneuraminate synthase family protein [Paenibacillus sp. OV219]SEN65734.1 N-acetylneuraminate synthase [Paenibacillus sp. OV219]
MRPRVIAEIGCNHKGDMEIAKELIMTAAVFCKVDAVKFQKRNNKELLTAEQYHAPHPNPHQSYGSTYGQHREFLEFDVDQHKQLKAWCEQYDLAYSTSVWDLTSAQEIAALKPQFIKIPSALNLHFDMLGFLCSEYEGEIHLSLGMTTKQEERDILDFFVKNKRAKDVVLYSCTSGYPVPFEDICLREISRLRESYGSIVKEIGFSGHHNGISVDIAAYTLGATTIERHYTLNRTWKGTDHAASLEPDGLRRLARDLRAVQKSLTYKEQDLLEIEIEQRDKLKWRNH